MSEHSIRTMLNDIDIDLPPKLSIKYPNHKRLKVGPSARSAREMGHIDEKSYMMCRFSAIVELMSRHHGAPPAIVECAQNPHLSFQNTNIS
jgi:hypothetical protein